MNDLIERLRAADCAGTVVPLMNKAADALEHSVDKDLHNAIVRQKNKRIEQLEAALRPFADAHHNMIVPNQIINPYDHITLHDLRVAAETQQEQNND